MYDIAFYAALIIFSIGLIHKLDRWFLVKVGTGDRNIPLQRRLTTALKGILKTFFSLRIFALLRTLIVDVLFQGRILRDKKDPLIWIAHTGIFYGFIVLLLFHALGTIFYSYIAEEYQSTQNPFLWLRDLSGLVLFVGLLLALIRRVLRRANLRTTSADAAALGLLLLIACSGFLLQGLQITSHTEFMKMVEDYQSELPEEDLRALRSYWVEQYGVVAPEGMATAEPSVVARGQELNEESCALCHDDSRSAFASFAVARSLGPVALGLDQAGLVPLLWWIHVLAVLFGLAYLVFGKMFHVVGTPVSLMIADASRGEQDPAAALTRQVIELDGCSHGGDCHENCPVFLRRQERIGDTSAYEPMLHYLEQKSAADLGSREVLG